MKKIAKAQKIWAENKYYVLSKSQNTYNEIRNYLKSDDVDIKVLEEMIARAREKEEDKGQVINAVSHIWGYFKDQADPIEKEAFLKLTEAYKKDRIKASDIFRFLGDMLSAYPNDYLENSTIFKEYSDETLA